MQGELVKLPPGEFMPVLTIEQAIQRRNYMVEFTTRALTENLDYGKIPGAGEKKVLLKAGAEKLISLFGLSVLPPVIVEKTEDWTGKDHGGEPFFYYLVRQDLARNGQIIASQMGSCNSWEKKYRYRGAERKCPHCGKSSIIKGKAEFGGGWLCWAKKGGCGTKFNDNDPAIANQSDVPIKNHDIADIVNTLAKMAQKRALVAAVLVGVNASNFSTQDMEHAIIDGVTTEVRHDHEPAPAKAATASPQRAPREAPTPQQGSEVASGLKRPDDSKMDPAEVITPEMLKYLNDFRASYGRPSNPNSDKALRDWMMRQPCKQEVEKLSDMSVASYRIILETIPKWPKAKNHGGPRANVAAEAP